MSDLGVGQRIYINDAGQIAGQKAGGAFLWEDGVFTDLGSFSVSGINNCGQVLGIRGGIDGADNYVFLWEDGVITDLGSAGYSGWAADINDSGQVVGSMDVEPRPDGYQPRHAILWTRSY